jgi:hypothetical protein
MTEFTIASQEGAERYGAEVGATVDLKLESREETAVIAAGWLTEGTTAKKKEAKG